MRAETDAVAEEVSGLALDVDVSDPDAVDAMVAAVVERYGRPDVMVANAGIAPGSRRCSTSRRRTSTG